MMVALGVYVRRGQRTLRKFLTDSRVHAWAQCAAWLLSGFAMSAASLGSRPQPLALGLLLATAGWPTVLFSAGSMAGYLLFWGAAGAQGVVWIMAGTVAAVLRGGAKFRDSLVACLKHPPYTQETCAVLGPAPCLVPKINYNFRYRLTLRCSMTKGLRFLLAHLLRQFSKDPQNRGVTAFIDVNGFDA